MLLVQMRSFVLSILLIEPALKILIFHDNENPPSLSGNGGTSQPPCATIASASVWR